MTTLGIADANDPRVGVYVQRHDQRTFWDYVETCDHAKEEAERLGLQFKTGSILGGD